MNNANSLLNRNINNVSFFYATPADSFIAEGEQFSTSNIVEARNYLQQSSKEATNISKIVGALPFHPKTKPYFLIPDKIYNSGPVGFTARVKKPIAIKPIAIQSVPSKDEFVANVKEALALFKTTDLKKIVLSRMLEVISDKPINIKTLLHNLLITNRLSRIFYLSQSRQDETAILIGATPEVIISKKGLSIYSNPLAGSIARSVDPNDDYQRAKTLLKSKKDLREHELVIKTMSNILRPYCSELYIPPEPSLISTPKMWHLSTQIRGNLLDKNVDALTLACALHPTPAVCGYPTKLARKYIELLESYNRGLYAGMIGWMNRNGDGEWALTIRCAEILSEKVRIYAGAGVVVGSDPELELAETTAKLSTLCDAIGLKI